MVACYSVEEVNTKWKALSEGGQVLMPLSEYPFSKWYGWVQDRYGLSWQLMLIDNRQTVQKITTNLLFSNESCEKAEEAVLMVLIFLQWIMALMWITVLMRHFQSL